MAARCYHQHTVVGIESRQHSTVGTVIITTRSRCSTISDPAAFAALRGEAARLSRRPEVLLARTQAGAV